HRRFTCGTSGSLQSAELFVGRGRRRPWAISGPFGEACSMSALPPLSGPTHVNAACRAWATSGCEQSQQGNTLFDYLVGDGKQRLRHVETERLGGFEVDR